MGAFTEFIKLKNKSHRYSVSHPLFNEWLFLFQPKITYMNKPTEIEKIQYSKMALDKFSESHKKYVLAKYLGAPKEAKNALYKKMKRDLRQYKESTKI